jgi:23S rRNA (uridine2552-2'-O)-methyltransferase
LKKNKISKNWINRQRKDIYVRKSKIEGYRSRAVYKLEEINQKFKIFHSGASVLDLGAAPGSWSQYILKNYKNIKLASIDLKKFDEIKNAYQIEGDFTDDIYKKKIINFFQEKIDIVLSDMAVNTTGNKNLDSIQTSELCLDAMRFSKEVLKKDGVFVSKIFIGSTFNEIVDESKKIFIKNKVFKPSASRKESKESFIISSMLR